MTNGNVYPLGQECLPRSLFGRPTRRSYRAAIKEIILTLMSRHGLSSLELSERLGCSKDTVDNAQDEACSLDILTLLSIAYAFGEEAIEPVRALYLCKPTEGLTPLQRIERANLEITAATDEMIAANEREQAKRYARAMEEMRGEETA